MRERAQSRPEVGIIGETIKAAVGCLMRVAEAGGLTAEADCPRPGRWMMH